MPDIVIRPADSTDLALLANFDHGYSTDYVWQMDTREAEGEFYVSFRQVYLPRPMRVFSSRSRDWLTDSWSRRKCFLVAELDELPHGYLNLGPGPAPDVGLIADFAVERRSRRQGLGSALLLAARQWARENGLRRLILETQTKNYPAIRFCQKHGFSFCGYNDRYYANMDIALFFGLNLR